MEYRTRVSRIQEAGQEGEEEEEERGKCHRHRGGSSQKLVGIFAGLEIAQSTL